MGDSETLKVVLLGDSGVGKTSIISQFINGKFDPDCITSLAAKFASKTIEFKDIKKTIKFDIWDTAGQEQYRSLAKIFYKDSKIIIFVYDITSRKSFDELKDYWIPQTKSECNPDVIFAIAGNKIDKYDEGSVVTDEEGKELAKSVNAIFAKTSAKTNAGIESLFQNLGYKYFNPKYDIEASEQASKQRFEQKQKEEEEKRKNRQRLTASKSKPITGNAPNRKKCC